MRITLLLYLSYFLINGVQSEASHRSPDLKAAVDSLSKHSDIGNFTKAEQWLDKAYQLLGNEPHPKDYFQLRYNEGYLLLKKRQLDAAEPILMECLSLARQSADRKQLVIANAVMSHLKAQQSLYGASIVYGNEALSGLTSEDSLQYYGLTSNISIAYMHIRETEKSLQYALAAKDYYERENLYRELALCLNNLGELYREYFNDIEMAEKHYRHAIAINKSHGYLGGLSENYLNLALTFDGNNQIDSALYYALLAKKLRLDIGDVGGLAVVYNALGQISMHKGDMPAAQKAFSETVRLSKEHQITPGLYFGNLGLGELHFKSGGYSLAKNYFERALATAKELDSKAMIASCYKSLYDLELEDGDFKMALTHFEAYSAYTDSVRMMENENQVAGLKTQYEIDLANSENRLLKANQASQNAELEGQRMMFIGLWILLGLVLIITVILYISHGRRSKSLKKEATLRKELEAQYHTVQLQKEELKELNELKNNIFSVLGHDLKTPLNNISSLVSLMKSGDLKQKEFIGLTSHLDQETKAGLVTLKNILNWSQAKTGNGKLVIKELAVASIVSEYLNNNNRQIEQKKLQIITHWNEAQTLMADENQFTSIVFNLLSNAIKFSPVGATIHVRTLKNEKGTFFIVQNEGASISVQLIEKLNSREVIDSQRGTMGEKGTGIGLRIVNDFVMLHGGHLKFGQVKTGGTEVEVFFPEVKSRLKVEAYAQGLVSQDGI